MGPGKLIPWSQFEGVLQIPDVLEMLDPPSQTKPSFKSVRHRHVKKTSTRDRGIQKQPPRPPVKTKMMMIVKMIKPHYFSRAPRKDV